MPEINLTTNVKVEDPKSLVLALSKLGAELTGYPEKLIGARYTYNEYQTFAGTFDSAFSLDFLSLEMTPELNIKLSKSFSELLTEKLGVSNMRGFIKFIDPGSDFVGFAGTTVTEAKKAIKAKQT